MVTHTSLTMSLRWIAASLCMYESGRRDPNPEPTNLKTNVLSFNPQTPAKDRGTESFVPGSDRNQTSLYHTYDPSRTQAYTVSIRMYTKQTNKGVHVAKARVLNYYRG